MPPWTYLDTIDPIDDPIALCSGSARSLWRSRTRQQVDALNGQVTYWTERTETDGAGDVLRSTAYENVRAVLLAADERSLDRAVRVLALIVKLDLVPHGGDRCGSGPVGFWRDPP